MSRAGIPLALAACGEILVVRSVRGGKKRSSQLASMGILPGSELSLISKGRGPVVVDIRGSRLAIGRSMALSIMV